MSTRKLGTLLRMRREELALTQEELADGICSVPTLSRIENGERMPTKNHFEALVERLGLSSLMLDCFIDENTLRINELKYQIQLSYRNREYAQAREQLARLEGMVTDHTSLDWQFVLYYCILLCQETLSPERKLERLEEALLLSWPYYKTKGIPRLMSYSEINILNTIANTYGQGGKIDQAIAIYQHIRGFYESHATVPEEIIRTQPAVLYNLSKCLGQAGRYDECIEICDQGIRIARRTGRCICLAKTLYNRGWALLKRGRENDRVQAEISLRRACYQAYTTENQRELKHFRAFYEENFGSLAL